MADERGAAAAPAMEEMLDCVQITPEHIRANGTLHSSPFEGIAELIDNAVDSQARTVNIENRLSTRPKVKIEQSRYLIVADDGAGMDRKEALKTILVGHSLKRGDVGMIGQFGNGLKSGSMRIGETMLLATKKDREFTVLMISLKYLDTLNDHKCYVPCISYTELPDKTFKMLKTAEERAEKHDVALKLILEYSPFHDERSLHTFLKENLSGTSGTVVAVGDLKRLESGNWELGYASGNFRLEKPQSDGDFPLLSVWLQQLYIDSKIVICIGGRQVRVQDPRHSLAHPRWVPLSREKMDQFVKREQENVNKEQKKLEAIMVPVSLRVRELQNMAACAVTTSTKEMRVELRMKQNEQAELKQQIENIKKRTDGKNRPGADIRVYLGMDVEHRNQPRIVFYSSGRRICTKELGWKSRDAFHSIMGVVAIVDIPSTLLTTTQNRERFEIPSEFDFIVKKIVKHAKTYFEYVDVKFKTDEYWRTLGYKEEDAPETDEGFIDEHGTLAKLALQGLPHILRQCGRCRQFRMVAYEPNLIQSIEENTLWHCKERAIDGKTKCIAKTRAEVIAEEIKELTTAGKPTKYEGKKERAQKAAEAAAKSRKPLAKAQPAERGCGRKSREDSFINDRSRSRSPVAARKNKRKSRDVSPADSDMFHIRSSPPCTRRRNTSNNPRSEMSSRAPSVRSSTSRQKRRGPYDSSSGSESEEDGARSERARSESVSTDSEDRRLDNRRSGQQRATRTPWRDYDGENDGGRDGPFNYPGGSPHRHMKREPIDQMNQRMERATAAGGHDEQQDYPLFGDAPIATKREEDDDETLSVFAANCRQKYGGLGSRVAALAEHMYDTPPPATVNAAERKRKSDERERMDGDFDTKKKNRITDAFEDAKREETDDQDQQQQHHDSNRSSVVRAAAAAGAAAALDDTIARIYAGDIPQAHNPDSVIGSDNMNKSLLDGAPRSSIQTRQQRELHLGQKFKTYAELMTLALNLQEQFHAIRRESEQKGEQLESVKRDLHELSALPNNDAERALRKMADAIDPTVALAAELAEIGQRGQRGPSSVDHEEEV